MRPIVTAWVGMGFQHLLPGLGRHGRMAISLLLQPLAYYRLKMAGCLCISCLLIWQNKVFRSRDNQSQRLFDAARFMVAARLTLKTADEINHEIHEAHEKRAGTNHFMPWQTSPAG
jgi:hypothetical protein